MTALRMGISLLTVQKILGHDSLQATAIYVNFTNVHIEDEFERKREGESGNRLSSRQDSLRLISGPILLGPRSQRHDARHLAEARMSGKQRTLLPVTQRQQTTDRMHHYI